MFDNHRNPFQTLSNINIKTNNLLKEIKYNCPFRNDTHFYSLLPIAINTNDISKYSSNEINPNEPIIQSQTS